MTQSLPLIRWKSPTHELGSPELGSSRWSFARNFLFASHLTSVPIVPTEFMHVAHEYPIGFVEQGNGWIPVALLQRQDRTAPHPNHFINREGQWNAAYVPLLLRVYPFSAEIGAAPPFFMFRLVQDPTCVGAGFQHACQSNGQPSEATDAVVKQVRQALGTYIAQAFAARTLATAGLMRPLPASSLAARDQAPIIHVLASSEKERFAANIAHWYRISPLAAQMAVAAFFSYARRPDLRGAPAPVTPPPPEPSRPLAQPPASQDLSWLDFGDKIEF